MSDKSKVFVSVTMSLDGFIAPILRPDDEGGHEWMRQWSELQRWVFPLAFFRERLKLGEGGETGADNTFIEQTFARTGVSIMGKRMFDGGEQHWPEEAPFRTPVFVVTHTERVPWPRPGGTIFYFVNDGIERALGRARDVAGAKDIRIAGGANLIQAYLNAGLVDELQVALSPVILGQGIPLFAGVDPQLLKIAALPTVQSPMVTHLTYVTRRP